MSTIAELKIKVQSLSDKQNLPFKLITNTNGEIVILVDVVAKETIPAAAKPVGIHYSERSLLTGVIKEPEDIYNLSSFPPELVPYLETRIIKYLANPELYINDDKTDSNIKSVLVEYSKAVEEKKKDADCKPCVIGAINRIFIPKILKILHGEEKNNLKIGLLRDIHNTLKCSSKDESALFIKETKLRTLNDTYLDELAAAKNKVGGCTTCQMNALKTKYANLLVTMINTYWKPVLLN